MLESSVDLTQIAQQIKSIQEAITRLEKKVTSIETTHRDIREIKSRVLKEAISGARERQKIQKSIENIHDSLRELKTPQLSKRGTDIPKSETRVGIFVDVQNIFYASKQFNARLDFEKLLTVSVNGRRLIRATAYVVQSPEVDQSSFISMLQQKSYEVRRKDLRQRSDGSAKGDWDMGMAIDIMRLVDSLDVVVLVSGDGDFVPLVDLVKTLGPRVEVISFTHNTARDLINRADGHIPIEDTLLLRLSHNTRE
jgi:uncharacterized LabA/DUF88 family protein/DNA-binding FrmR family transcriptional regulator